MLGKSSHASARGISSLMETIEKEGLPESFSRSSQYRAKKSVCDTETPYGKLVTHLDVTCTTKDPGGQPLPSQLRIAFQNPLAFLYLSCSQSSHYAMVMRAALASHPPSPASPWSIILYSDAIDPTDTASKSHTRKIVVYYWSFLEFGMSALCHEQMWGTLTAVRETRAKCLDGGVAGLTSMALDQFHGPEFDILRAGITLKLVTGERARLFAKVGVMLGDEPALKDMLDCKGHAGLKCCVLCQNCVLHKSQQSSVPLHVFGDYAVSIAEPDFKRFQMHTDDTLREVVAKINTYKSTLSNTDFAARSLMLGFNWNPKQILCNPRFQLQGVSMLMWDWAHVYICDGVADSEFGDFMQVMERSKSGTTYKELGQYVESFTLPSCRPSLTRLFDGSRYRNYIATGKFSATASEFLSLAPILRRYLECVAAPRGNQPKHVASMLAALDVIDLLQACKHPGCVRPKDLYSAIALHFRAFLVAYGQNETRPKHHYALHLPLMLKQFGVLMNTLMHERRHKVAKRYSSNRFSTVQFETGMVEDVTCHQLWELSLPFFKSIRSSKPTGVILHALRDLFPGTADCDMSLHTCINVNGGDAKDGDVVSFALEGHQCVGKLCLTVGIATPAADRRELISIVSVWDPVASVDVRCRTYIVTARQVKVETAALGTVFVHWMSPCKSRCTILVPYELR